MRVGVVVEGQSEYKALPAILNELRSVTEARAVKVLHASYDPHASLGRIVRACRTRVQQLVGRRYDVAIVLVDREQRTESSSVIAHELEAKFARAGFGIPVHVVVKDRCFENWLIADIDALRAVGRRFEVSNNMAQRVQPNKADHVQALQLLKHAARGNDYGKIDDAKRILEKASAERIGCHSRSFRCFLGRLGHPAYATGSCVPAGA